MIELSGRLSMESEPTATLVIQCSESFRLKRSLEEEFAGSGFCLFVCLFVYLFVCLSVCWFVCWFAVAVAFSGWKERLEKRTLRPGSIEASHRGVAEPRASTRFDFSRSEGKINRLRADIPRRTDRTGREPIKHPARPESTRDTTKKGDVTRSFSVRIPSFFG